jgi:hypothetical protein
MIDIDDASEDGNFLELPWEGGPICSQLCSLDLAEGFRRTLPFRSRIADYLADSSFPYDRQASDEHRADAERYRDLAWEVEPGDQMWVTIDPRDHPEVEIGVASLVIVRKGTIIHRERLGVF